MIDRPSMPEKNGLIIRDSDYIFFREFVLQHAGIVLPANKEQFFFSRLLKRIRQLNLPDFFSYCEFLRKNSDEAEKVFNFITNGNTDFFRESYHFDFLKQSILPSLRQKQKKIRIWSAGCSTGEEPYSIAMILNDAGFDAKSDDVKILATDINSTSIEFARMAVYPNNRRVTIQKLNKDNYFSAVEKHDADHFVIPPKISNFVSFERLNLIDPWPMRGPFDVIFFRNVAIYLDKTINQQILTKMINLLPSTGFLIIGHSETLGESRHLINLVGNSIYQKK